MDLTKNIRNKLELLSSVLIKTPLNQFWVADFSLEIFKVDVRHDFKDYYNSEIFVTRLTKNLVEVSSNDKKLIKLYDKEDYKLE